MKPFLKSLLRHIGYDIVTYRPFLELLGQWGITTVLDVGANIGQFGEELRCAEYRGKIISFEPISSSFVKLETTSKKDPLWEVVRIGLGKERKSLTVPVPTDSRLTSLLRPSQRHAFVTNELIEIERLDEWLSGRRVHLPSTCLKLDVQGFEREVLMGAGSLLPQFGAIIVELSYCHSYEDQPLAEEIIALLRTTGFSPWTTRRGLWTPHGNREMEVDMLFKKC